MTKPSEVKGIGPIHIDSYQSPRDKTVKPIHQFTWPQDRSYEVVYEIIIDGTTTATMTETVKASSYAHAAWRLARILPFSESQAYNLLDVVRLS